MLYLQLNNTNSGQSRLPLPSFSHDGIQYNTALQPTDIIQGEDLILHFTIAPPVSKIYESFELKGLTGVTQDMTIANNCTLGDSVDANNPCHLKLTIPADQIQGKILTPELIIKWQDQTQAQITMNPINVVDINESGADLSNLADMQLLEKASTYADINDDGIKLYVKNTTGKALSGVNFNLIATWLNDLVDTSLLAQGTSIAIDQALEIDLLLRSDKTIAELYTAVKAHLGDVLANANSNGTGGKIISINASHAINNYLPDVIVDVFPYIAVDGNQQKFDEIMIFNEPSIKSYIITNPTMHDFDISFSEALPQGITRVSTGSYNGYANCSEFTTLLAGESCTLVVEAAPNANEATGDHIDIILTPQDSAIPDSTLNITFQTNYVYDVGYMPEGVAIEIPIQGSKVYNLKLVNNETYAQWSPSSNIGDYSITHDQGIDGLTITHPDQPLPSCLTNSSIASGDYCYIGLEVDDNATPQTNYLLKLNKGESNLAHDDINIGNISVVDHGSPSFHFQRNAQAVAYIYSGESVELVITPPEGWENLVSEDITFSVASGNASITFPQGNQCTLSLNDPHSPCMVSLNTSSTTQTGSYSLTISSNLTTIDLHEINIPVIKGEDIIKVSSGVDSSCSIDINGEAYCWGDNLYGQLGNGTTDDSNIPVKVAQGEIPIGSSLIDISVSLVSCAIADNGKAYCWGSNNHGQPGNGSTLEYNSIPVEVAQGEMPLNSKFTKIQTHSINTCGLAVSAP